MHQTSPTDLGLVTGIAPVGPPSTCTSTGATSRTLAVGSPDGSPNSTVGIPTTGIANVSTICSKAPEVQPRRSHTLAVTMRMTASASSSRMPLDASQNTNADDPRTKIVFSLEAVRPPANRSAIRKSSTDAGMRASARPRIHTLTETTQPVARPAHRKSASRRARGGPPISTGRRTSHEGNMITMSLSVDSPRVLLAPSTIVPIPGVDTVTSNVSSG